MNSRHWLARFLGGLALAVLGLLVAADGLRGGSVAASSLNTAVRGGTSPQTCGYAWQVVASPDAGPNNNTLVAIADVDAGNIWAVGYYINGSTQQTLVEHWDGNSWSVVPSPNIGSGANKLVSVAAVSDTDVWAVGSYNNGTALQPLGEHWDGGGWTAMTGAHPGGPTEDNELLGVAAVDGSNVWAVGYYRLSDLHKVPLTEQWNGSSWTSVPTPAIQGSPVVLTAVTAVASNDIWAVGYDVYHTLAEHWDGSAWSIVASPNVGGSNALLGLSWLASNDIWAVGNYSNGGMEYTLTEHWNGLNWVYVPSPNIGTVGSALFSVSTWSSNNVWAVGAYNDGTKNQTLTELWDGTSWATVDSPNVGSGSNWLNGVAMVGYGEVWSAGYGDAGSTQQTLAEHYSLGCFTDTPTSTPTTAPTSTSTATPVPTSCTLQFTDVPQGSTFYSFVRCMACRGIVNGYASGCETGNPCFRPNNNVTRGQLSKIVSNAAGFSDNQTTRTFQDVPVGSTFFQYAGRLASRGFISGYPCGTPLAGACVPPGNLPYFLPNANSTRGQISKIVSNAAGYSETPGGQQFQDVPSSSAFYAYIYRLVFHTVMSGYQCGTPPAGACVPPGNLPYFRPGNNATRGQTSKIVSNTFFPNCQTP